MQGYDAVIAGHICVDMTPLFGDTGGLSISELIVPGKLLQMEGIEVSPGGAVPNTGIALSRLGTPTTLVGRIGDDAFGTILQRLLTEYGAGEGLSRVSGERTSYTIVIAPPETDRVFLHDPGANDSFTASDIDLEAISRARLFHFGYPPLMARMYEDDGAELVKVMGRAKELGVTTSLDMALPSPAAASGKANWREILRRVLPYVDIFLPSLEELLFMLDRERYDELNGAAGDRDLMELVTPDLLPGLGSEMIDRGVAVAGIKCGKLGFYLKTAGADRLASVGSAPPGEPPDAGKSRGQRARWAGRELFSEVFELERLASTTGAGDSSIAGFLRGYLAGRSPERCLEVACAAGARTATVYDTLSGLEPLEELEEQIDKGWARRRTLADLSEWRYDDDLSLWRGNADSL